MKLNSLLSLVLAAALATPAVSFASLGGSVSTVQSDQAHMKASLRIASTTSSYTVHEMQTVSGTTVREYVAKDGTVFGVAWTGPAIPDLQQLLGQYFSALSDASAVKHISHTQMHVQQADLVMHSSGHMRAFAGQAYLTSKLPAGVSASNIQ